ncbi:LutC/YkgG family protein [Hydrogenimonas urashimensis]|uniref:LutC/YkgG family protein n=1 Tax=Hydrogenimonas urashimensis TaxID=2740515 RepID=UPI001916C2A4|nr:LUD domain-containing protein [Hydrogenimonas urashimensis]
MSEKMKIFANLKDRCDEPEAPPAFDFAAMRFDDPIEAFKNALKAAGGDATEVRGDLKEAISAAFADATIAVDTRLDPVVVPEKLSTVGLAIVEASFGVAENGAVWIDPRDRYPRELLTLAENLAVLLPAERIVATMHEAYERIDLSETGYALFLCGPSKTADIEQALVIGAHGAIALRVFLT